MASQFNTVGRHQAFLALTFRASLKAFAVVFRAAVAVVLKQRNGVVDLFLDGERTIADAAVAQREAGLLQEVFLLLFIFNAGLLLNTEQVRDQYSLISGVS
eukprot:148342_1